MSAHCFVHVCTLICVCLHIDLCMSAHWFVHVCTLICACLHIALCMSAHCFVYVCTLICTHWFHCFVLCLFLWCCVSSYHVFLRIWHLVKLKEKKSLRSQQFPQVPHQILRVVYWNISIFSQLGLGHYKYQVAKPTFCKCLILLKASTMSHCAV